MKKAVDSHDDLSRLACQSRSIMVAIWPRGEGQETPSDEVMEGCMWAVIDMIDRMEAIHTAMLEREQGGQQ